MIETGNMRAGGNEMNRKAKMKKCMVFFLSIAMVLAMSVPAFAAEGGATANMETTPAAAQDNTIADIQSKIDKLPDAGDITSDNVGDVKAQLEIIDKAKAGLTDEEISKLKTDKYTAAVEKISKLEQGENADVPKDVADETVAQIGNQEYPSLKEAIDSIQDETDTTIVLAKDVNEDISVEKGKNITLDLNGKTLTGTGASGVPVVSNKGTFSLVDSAGNGKVQSAANANNYVFDNQGEMILGTENGENSFSVGVLSETNAASIIRNGWEQAGDKPADIEKAVMIVNGGDYTGNTASSEVIVNKIYGDVVINNGVFTQKNKAQGCNVILSHGKLVINGGSFKKEAIKFTQYCIYTMPSNVSDFQSEARIYNGEFNVSGGSDSRTVNSQSGSSLLVYGGIYNVKITGANLPEGYVCIQNSSKKYEVGAYIAEWNKTGYGTISEAIEAAKNSTTKQTITLLQNTTESIDIPENMSIQLDLNGHVLTGVAGDHTIDNKGVLQISGTGKSGIVTKAEEKQAIYNSGKLTFISTSVAKISRSEGSNGDVVYNSAGGNMTVGAKVSISSPSSTGSCVYNLGELKLGTSKKIPKINGATVAIKNGGMGALTVNNADITGYDQAIQNCSQATISGGIINGAVVTLSYSDSDGVHAGKTEITGGSIEGKDSGSIIACWYTGEHEAEKVPEVTITGGAINGAMYKASTTDGLNMNHVEYSDEKGVIAVSGGTFDQAVPKELCANDYASATEPDENGKYPVIKLTAENAAASVVSADNSVKYYAALEDAIENAEAGETVNLLKDVEYNDLTIVDLSGVTLDLCTHKISGNNMNTIIFTGKNFTIKNGMFSTRGSYSLWIGDEVYTDNVTVEGVATEGGINIYNAHNVKLRDVTAVGNDYYAVWADQNAKVTIESGDYSTQGSNGLIGATFTDGIINVTGGTFTVNDKNFAPAGNDNIKISGGKFNERVPDNYCADGYLPLIEKDSNGMYTVVASAAQIGDKEYTTIEEALKAAKDGDTVELLKNVEIKNGETVTIASGVTLKINDNATLTNQGTIEIYGDITGKVSGTGTVNYHIKAIAINAHNNSMKVGEEQSLTVTKTPENAVENVAWSIDNDKVATIDENGKLIAIGEGTVTVTAKAADGITADCTITVSKSAPAVQEAPAKADIKDSTYTTITLAKIDTNKNGAVAKYSSDGGKTWQDSNVFENLLPGTEYTFVVRYDATKDGNYAESPVSEELKASTKTGATAATVTPDDRKALSDEKSELDRALENGVYSDADKAKLKQRISEIDAALSKLDSGSDSGADFSDDTNPADNSCNADLAGSEDNLIDALLTDEEKNELENGKDVKVWLKVTDISATVSEPDKDLVDTKRGNATVGMYLDIDLLKQIGSDPSQNITETNGPITITLKVPDTLVNTDASVTRTYQMIRVHDGKVTVIPCNYDAAKQTISFETDQFSTYALAYVDRQNSSGGGNITDTAKPGDASKPAATDPNAGAATGTQTGDSSNLLLWFTLLFLSGFGVTATIMASRKKKASR